MLTMVAKISTCVHSYRIFHMLLFTCLFIARAMGTSGSLDYDSSSSDSMKG